MMRCAHYSLAVVLVLAAVVSVSGCGGSSAGETTSGGSAKEFTKPGGKQNKYAEFGREASDEEREAASRVLEENLQARTKGEWAKQCSSLARAAVEGVEGQGSSGDGGHCAADLKQLASPLPDTIGIRADTLTGPIDVLMVRGRRAYALYHGKKGKDYAMPMEKVAGQWKVGSLRTTEIP